MNINSLPSESVFSTTGKKYDLRGAILQCLTHRMILSWIRVEQRNYSRPNGEKKEDWVSECWARVLKISEYQISGCRIGIDMLFFAFPTYNINIVVELLSQAISVLDHKELTSKCLLFAYDRNQFDNESLTTAPGTPKEFSLHWLICDVDDELFNQGKGWGSNLRFANRLIDGKRVL